MPIIDINNNTNLAGVLTNNPSTNGIALTSNDGFKTLMLNNTIAYLQLLNGALYGAFVANSGSAVISGGDDDTTSSNLTVNKDFANLVSDLLIKLNAPNVELTQETASLILSTDASKRIKGLSTSTYPSLTELAFVKGLISNLQVQLYRSYSPFLSVSVISLTGTTAETLIYTSSPNLVGKLLSGDVLMWAGAIQATNNANTKTIRFYISDAQASLSNEVLIGTVTGTSAFVNTANFDKILTMTSISTQNVIAGTGTTTNTGTTMGTTAIDFSTGTKYFIATLQLSSGTDTVKIQFGRSTIHRG